MTEAHKERAIAILCLLMMPLGQIGIDLYTPSLPHMVSSLHTSNGAIQLTATIYLTALAFSLLLSGPISDHLV